MAVRFDSRSFGSMFGILVWFLHAFSRVPSASYYNYCKIRNRNSLKFTFLIDQQFLPSQQFLNLPLRISKQGKPCVTHFCQVLKHGNKWTSNRRSSCPFFYSQIESLGLHVVYITCCVIRIKKHLHNQIKIIKIERR